MNTETKTEWRMVPVEPTKEMLKAALRMDVTALGVATYKAMLNAAPTPPASEPCDRCAELEESMHKLALDWQVKENKLAALETSIGELNDSLGVLDICQIKPLVIALEAEKEEITQAIRWAPSSAHWSNVLIKLCGEDSRDGINALEKQLREAQATIAQQAEQLAVAQKEGK